MNEARTVGERRERLERTLRGCAERGVPADTVDLWPAIRERVSGEQTTETHVSQESVSDPGSRGRAWPLRLVPDTPLGYALAVFSVLIIAAGAYAASAPVGEFLRGGLPDPGAAGPIEPPEGVRSYEVVENAEHIEGNLDYPQSPPVGGNHDPVWQNCGFYEISIAEENAVHSMEHGAVWIAYSFDLPQQQVERLRDLAQNHDYVLVSPYPGLGLSKAPAPAPAPKAPVPQLPTPRQQPAPQLLASAPAVPEPAPAPKAPAPAGTEPTIVASAWGKQLSLWSAEDPDLERFIRAYSQGPQAPEQGAPCTVGVGSPQ